jgi:hypothetical protein
MIILAPTNQPTMLMCVFSLQKRSFFAVLFLSVTLFSSCLTSQKMDKFVAAHYNNQLPKEKKKTDITVTSKVTYPSNAISTTVQKTSKVLPLLVYWQMDYRHTCTLNPAIAVNQFATTINTLSSKGLNQKLNGQRLELSVEQIPTAFALVDKAHMIWLVYAISWEKVYMEPDAKDLIVSYKLLQNDNTEKTGKITVKSTARNQGLRYFQSWKSATSEQLADYSTNITAMSKTFVTKLMEEL